MSNLEKKKRVCLLSGGDFTRLGTFDAKNVNFVSNTVIFSQGVKMCLQIGELSQIVINVLEKENLYLQKCDRFSENVQFLPLSLEI